MVVAQQLQLAAAAVARSAVTARATVTQHLHATPNLKASAVPTCACDALDCICRCSGDFAGDAGGGVGSRLGGVLGAACHGANSTGGCILHRVQHPLAISSCSSRNSRLPGQQKPKNVSPSCRLKRLQKNAEGAGYVRLWLACVIHCCTFVLTHSAFAQAQQRGCTAIHAETNTYQSIFTSYQAC